MGDFRQLTDTFSASPQIDPGDIEQAAREGFVMIINNRPDGEDPGQPSGSEIAAAAQAAGLEYRTIPINHTGFGESQITAMQQELAGRSGKILAYCRSGTRSTLLWALARAAMGDDPDSLAAAARAAGYDVSPVRPALESLAARARA